MNASPPPVLPVPDSPDADALLEAFVAWAEARGLSLYPAQEEAILELFDGNNLILATPTGSGKSLVAVAMHLRSLARGERTVYTSPIKALVSEKFFDLCATFGAERVGMITGDGAINGDAPIVCCTAEILSNMALVEGRDLDMGSVVMDEFHFYADPDRGAAWQIPLLLLDRARFLLISATLGDTSRIEGELEALTGAPVAVVRGTERPVPLVTEYVETPLLETLEDLVGKDRAPIYLVNFSQREASDLAQALTSSTLADKDRRQRVRDEVKGFRFDSPYGEKLKRIIGHGLGVHHAGLLPKYRRLVERLAGAGLLVVIAGTDTLGVGVNVPIRTVLFTRLYKFDGRNTRLLSVRETQQIAGRAGRKGHDDVGYVVCQAPEHVIENNKLQAKVDAGLLSKKKFRRVPQPKGYVAYDEEAFHKLVNGTPEELEPTFDVDHGMLLSLMQQHPDDAAIGYARLLELIEASHMGPADKQKMVEKSEQLLRSLIHAELVDELPRGGWPQAELRLAPDLQDDFSIFHTLALWFLRALELLDREHPEYPLQVIGLAEAMMENPWPVLYAQERREKGDKIGQLKAEGLDYHERMEALEEVTWPKPDADWIYGTFNDWLEKHPWLAAEHIRPKGVAREIVRDWATFAEYVRDLKLQAVEGVLLRYLSQVYQVVARSVPEAYQTEPLLEAVAYLRTTIAQADSSLITEWEAMLNPEEEAEATPEAPKRADISRNRRAFTARVRAELHALVRALARGEWDEAAALTTGPDRWRAADFEQVMGGFFEEFELLRFDHRARLAEHTILREVEDHRWEVSQALLGVAEAGEWDDPNADEDPGAWRIEGEVDLREDTAPEGPLVRVIRIGE